MTSARRTTLPASRALGLLALLVSMLSALVVTAPPARAADSYPWRADTSWTADTFGFTKRQCTSYVAWRLYTAGLYRVNNTRGYWGNASRWDDVARSLGKRVTSTPRVGAVAHWNAYERGAMWWGGTAGTFRAGSAGHVGVVVAVYGDRSVAVRQYNLNGNRSYSQVRMKAPRYLVLG